MFRIAAKLNMCVFPKRVFEGESDTVILFSALALRLEVLFLAYINEASIQNEKERQNVEAVLAKINSKNRSGFWRIKRTVDIVLSVFALVVSALPLGIICLVVFLSDGHNPIYAQKRIGRFGKPFRMYKIRTMVPDADKLLEKLLDKNEMVGPAFKIDNDPRITKVGKFLRKTSLDELPQFFNVFLGNMTIIGPRPPLPREVEQYTEYQKIRLLVTPGITCLWQVSPRRNEISFDKWVALDIDYILYRSLWLDIKIVLRTIYVMICQEGR